MLTLANIHPAYFLIPIVLSLIAAIFEGISLGLLVPMLNGFLQGDYTFVKTTPILSTFLQYLPSSFIDRDRSLFITLAVIFVTSVVFKNIFKYISGLTLSYGSMRALHHLRKRMFERYLSFGKLYFDTTSVGQHTSVLTDLTNEAFTPLARINVTINALFSVIVYLVIMMTISWKLTLCALPLFFILHISVKRIVRLIETAGDALTQRSKDLGKKAVEILSSIPLVKAAGTERKEQGHYSDVSDDHAMLKYRLMALKSAMQPIQELIALFAAIALFSAMLYLLVIQKESNPSSFIVYFYLVLNSATKLGAFTDMRGQIAMSAGPIKEVLSVFEDVDKQWVPDGEKEFPGLQRSVEFAGVSYDFQNGKQALQDLRFTAEKGKTTAIVGPTGAGKTTLINLVMRFYDVEPNTLLLDGVDIRKYTAASIRKHIGLVSQDTLLLHDTLRNNITYGLSDVTDEQVATALKQSRLHTLVEALPQGLQTQVGDRGVKLSGGEKQRVAIARALLKGADILILDEATSSLDSKTEQLVQEAIDEASLNRTVLVIAHRLSTIKDADKVVVIEDGTCTEQGTLDQLLELKGKFYSLWQLQKFV